MNRPWQHRRTPAPNTALARSSFDSASTEEAAAWDSIIVGSSPQLLIEAICLARTGRKVLLLEDSAQLGGSWGHPEGNDVFPFLDIGCHYFDISRRAYEFLRVSVGLNLVPFFPQPQFAYRKIMFPFDNRQLIRVFRNLKNAVKQRSMNSFFYNLMRDENFRFRMYPFTKTFLFPQGGSHELISRLTALAGDANITIRNCMRVDSIHFDPRRKRVHVKAGGLSLEGKEIVAGSQARIADALQIVPGPGVTQRCIYTHVNLVFRDRGAPPFSYIRFIRHPAVIRMTDISSQMRYWCSGMDDYRVVCIGIRDAWDRSRDDPEKVDQLVDLLKYHRFVDSSAQCEMYYWSRYPAEFLSNATQSRLRHDFAPMIRLISTTNFSVGVVNNLDRWESAFASAPVIAESQRSMIR